MHYTCLHEWMHNSWVISNESPQFIPRIVSRVTNHWKFVLILSWISIVIETIYEHKMIMFQRWPICVLYIIYSCYQCGACPILGRWLRSRWMSLWLCKSEFCAVTTLTYSHSGRSVFCIETRKWWPAHYIVVFFLFLLTQYNVSDVRQVRIHICMANSV